MLFTKCILGEREITDGIRISVMSRHTLNDGKTIDHRIDGQFDEHQWALGPNGKLIGNYYKPPEHPERIDWDEFEKGYVAWIRRSDRIPLVRLLAFRASQSDLTIMCIEETPERCHRRLLAEECLRYEPGLTLVHH